MLILQIKPHYSLMSWPTQVRGQIPSMVYGSIAKPRQNIPGSTWLADVGTGTLTPEMKKYYKSNLEKLTKGNKALKIVMYCTADCWMAWNAVRRASKWGYTNILWFPEGTDEWVEAGHPGRKLNTSSTRDRKIKTSSLREKLTAKQEFRSQKRENILYSLNFISKFLTITRNHIDATVRAA